MQALQSQLCPEGSSSERCFYSQLSIFIRMHDELMDPVALRNIGKRNLPIRRNSFNHFQNHMNTGISPDVIPLLDLQSRFQEIKNSADIIDILTKLLGDTSSNEKPWYNENKYVQPLLSNKKYFFSLIKK
jgi:hypothetical protein